LQIIAIWNTKGRVCLNANNKDWLKELAKEIPEATWEIQNFFFFFFGGGCYTVLSKGLTE